MKHGLEFKVTDKDGKEAVFRQRAVPTQKLIEFMELTPENYTELTTQADWIKKNAEFIASLFDNKRVTPDFLLSHINAWDWSDFVDQIGAQMLGVDPKKLETEEK